MGDGSTALVGAYGDDMAAGDAASISLIITCGALAVKPPGGGTTPASTYVGGTEYPGPAAHPFIAVPKSIQQRPADCSWRCQAAAR